MNISLPNINVFKNIVKEHMNDDVVSPLFKRHCKVKVTDKQANAESSQPWFNLEF